MSSPALTGPAAPGVTNLLPLGTSSLKSWMISPIQGNNIVDETEDGNYA